MQKKQHIVIVCINGKKIQITVDRSLEQKIDQVKGLGKARGTKAKCLLIIALAYLKYLDKESNEKILKEAPTLQAGEKA